MAKLAIIGTGIAGLGCAHFLHRQFDLTLFEQNDYVGGHTNTVTVPEKDTGRPMPIDTGFTVYNEVTYPFLTRLFAQLRVPVKSTEMSFAVTHRESGLEFCSSSLNLLFAQRKNLFNARYCRLLRTINRFNRDVVAALEDSDFRDLTLGDYVRRRGYGEDFFNLYLVPMSSAVWSTPPDLMLSFPAITLLRFFHNHGFLGLHSQHSWLTVQGGAKTYVEKIIAPFRDGLQLGKKAVRVLRSSRNNEVRVTTADGISQSFDKVIIACHGDQALRLLVNPTADEGRTLGEFHYQPNIATLHTDSSVMPRTRRAWSSWNYEIARDSGGRVSCGTHYWMNSLQGVSDRENYFVSINRAEAIDPKRVLKTMGYEHPLFSLGAVRAQEDLPALNLASPTQTVYFCGSYFRYGFHEDALSSAVKLSEIILGRDPWARGAQQSTSLGN